MPGAVVGPAVVMAGAGAEVMNAGLAGVLGPPGGPAAVAPVVVGPAVVVAGAGDEVMNAGLAGVPLPPGEPAAVEPGAGKVGGAGAVP